MATIEVQVYDLSPVNSFLRFSGFGLYHSSIVVNGSMEYAFDLSTGISQTPTVNSRPQDFDQATFYATYPIGKVNMPSSDIRQLITNMRREKRWYGESYSTLVHNCNSFTYEFCKKVCTKQQLELYPKWILRSQEFACLIASISFGPVFAPANFKCMMYKPTLDDPDYIETDENQRRLLGG